MSPTTPTDTPIIVDVLVQLSFTIQAVLVRVATAHDLSVIQLRLLGVLRDREPGMLELARHLNLDKSSVTGLIDRAERRGLVQRKTTPEDGRAIRVSMTAQGHEIAAEMAGQVQQEINNLVAVLSETERNQLTATVSRLIAK